VCCHVAHPPSLMRENSRCTHCGQSFPTTSFRYDALPCHILPCDILPYDTLPCHILPCDTLPCVILSYDIPTTHFLRHPTLRHTSLPHSSLRHLTGMQLLLAGIRMAEATLINKYPFQCGLNAERAVEDDASLLTSSAVMSGRSFKCYLTENISRYLFLRYPSLRHTFLRHTSH
jgi:hypothetical protein